MACRSGKERSEHTVIVHFHTGTSNSACIAQLLTKQACKDHALIAQFDKSVYQTFTHVLPSQDVSLVTTDSRPQAVRYKEWKEKKQKAHLPSSDSMPARKQARVQDCTRVRLTPMLAAAATSPLINALAARCVVTRDDEHAVSTAAGTHTLSVLRKKCTGGGHCTNTMYQMLFQALV